MHIPVGLAFLFTVFLSTCASPSNQTSDSATPSGSATPSWQRTINTQPDSLASWYVPDAVQVSPAGEVISGAAAIARAYRANPFQVDSVYTLQAFPAGGEDRFSYEIGGFHTPSGEYRHLLIRDREQPREPRVLEMIAPVRPAPSARAAIDQRRAEWIERCNQHAAAALIENLYAPNTVYYNHRSVIIGREALAETYAYMNNPAYELSLEPLAFAMVNDTLAYEIGQCSGSYAGKYIIAWQRDAAGEWYVLLDSNI